LADQFVELVLDVSDRRDRRLVDGLAAGQEILMIDRGGLDAPDAVEQRQLG
jgi:hypothetical protein